MLSKRGSNYLPRIQRPEDVFRKGTIEEFYRMMKTHFQVENAWESLR